MAHMRTKDWKRSGACHRQEVPTGFRFYGLGLRFKV